MSEFILTLADVVPIKTGFSSPATVQMSVSDIVNYGINNNLGNAFMLLDAGNTRAGLAIRYFNINGDTAYLATTSYINDSNYIGIGESTNIQSLNNTGYICTNPWDTPPTLGAMGVAFNFGTKTINNIIYNVQGGNVSGYASQQAIYIPDTVTNIYVDGSPLISYQWSSVPRIEGKNKVYRLTDILNINDGNAVNDVEFRGNVDFSAKTKVNNLVKAVMERDADATKATITYEVQESSYEYVKMVYKEGSIPDDVNDGTAVDIDKDGSEVTIEGLTEETEYYFVIYTNKTDSEAYLYKTGHNPAVQGVWRETINSTKPIDDNFSMEFTEEESHYKVGDSSGTDAWIWLSSLGGKTLTTSTVDPTNLSNNQGIDLATISHGNNPITTWNETAVDFTKTWEVSDDLKFTAKPYASNPRGLSGTYWANMPAASGSSSSNYSYTCYGCDLMISVNHGTRNAKVWFYPIYTKQTGGNMNMISIAGSGEMLYAALKKYM